MALVEDLSVRISAATTDFQAGAQRVESKLGDLSTEALQTAGSMEVLSNRADDAGDNISQTGRRASVTAGQLNVLQGATTGANASFMGISATMWGSLIPAVTALGAALAPVIGALGGFVAVAGSIAAVGLLPAIGGILTHTESLKGELQDLQFVIESAFGPVFDLAAMAIRVLLQDFQRIIPALVPAQDVMWELSNLFIELGRAVISVLPAFVDMAVTLTQEFLPGFVRFTQDVLPEVPGMILGLVEVFDRMIPRFLDAGEAVIEFLDPFTEFGFTVLEVLGPALGFLIEQGEQLLEWFNRLDPTVQRVGASLSLLAPVIAGLSTLIGGPATGALAGLGAAAVLLARRFDVSMRNITRDLQSLWFGIRNFALRSRNAIQAFIAGLDFTALRAEGRGLINTLRRLWTEIQATIPPARRAFMAFIDGVDLQRLAQEGIEFARVLTERLDKTIQGLLPVLKDMQTFLRQNEEEIRIIGVSVGRTARLMANMATVIVEVLGPAFNKILIPALRTFVDYLDFAISNLATVIELMSQIKEGDFSGAVDVVGERAGELTPDQVEPMVANTAGATQQIQSEIKVITEERTDIVDTRIEAGAQRVVQEESDRTRRNTGTPTGL